MGDDDDGNGPDDKNGLRDAFAHDGTGETGARMGPPRVLPVISGMTTNRTSNATTAITEMRAGHASSMGRTVAPVLPASLGGST